jgi:hypothetical protein
MIAAVPPLRPIPLAFGAALAMFALGVLDMAAARDSFVCEGETCVLNKERLFGVLTGPSRRVEIRARDVKRFEPGPAEMRTGLAYVTIGVGVEDEHAELSVDGAAAVTARRFFESPSGRLAFEGRRRSRFFPFAAILGGLAVASFVAAWGRRGRGSAVRES